MLRKKLKEIASFFTADIKVHLKGYTATPHKACCGRVPTTELVNSIFNFCELYSGRELYPYQEQFSKRVIRSILDNDGEEITALFSRQSGKSETIATTVGGMMIILPQLANMPMFADDSRLTIFKDGMFVGIFAPSLRQAQTTYGRLKSRLQCKNAMEILNDPEFRLDFSTSNGQTVSLTNGSFATAISASEGANIEGESFKLIICEEAQDISNYKVRKSIHPMGAAYNSTIVKIGTATTFKGDFYDAIQRNKADMEKKKAHIKNHFEYDWKVAAKYNPKYAKYVEKERKRLGEKSDEFQMSYCVTPETKILTADLRWVRADSVKMGDKLVGFDEDKPKRYGQRKFKESIVEDVGVIKRPCYEVQLSDGAKVRCSSEHQWLVFTAGSRTQWKKTEDLVSTDKIYRVCNTWNDLPKDYKLGYLSASFDGEGCLSSVNEKLQQLTFSQRDNKMLEDVKQYLSDYGFEYNAEYFDKSKVESGYEPVYKLFVKGGKRELLRFLGSIRPKRLLDKFNPSNLGTVRCSNGEAGSEIHPYVTGLTYLGEQEVIPIRTTTRTYVAEGLASHNCLTWIISRGMFVDIDEFEKNNTEPLLERTFYDKRATHVAGIDLGGKGDDTVITMTEVNWDMPVVMESFTNEQGEEETYTAYNTYLKDWYCISNEPDYEEQYPLIVDYLGHFLLARVVCDATREASISHRLRANLKCEVIPFIFTPKSKSEMYKHLDREIVSGRARVCAGPQTIKTPEYLAFNEQLGNLQKGWSGTNMIVSHATEKDHDDYCLSLDTEILTKRGFLNYRELNDSDLVAKVVDNTLIYVKPNRKIVRHYSGVMYNFKSKDLDLKVTENHKMLTRHRKSGVEEVLLSQELANIKQNTLYNVRSIPVAPKQVLEDYPMEDNLIKQICWFITEGWVNKSSKYNSYRYSFGQSVYSPKYSDIQKFILDMNLKPYCYNRKDGVTYWTFHKKDNKLFDEILLDGIHRIPRLWLNEFSQRQLKLVLDTLMQGDGTISRNTYSTISLELARDFQELAHKLGIKTSIRFCKTKKIYNCYLMKKDETRIQKVVKSLYVGRVWCVNVDNGFIVTRCNNKIAVTGNCDSWALSVWGTSFRGEVNNTETMNNKFTSKTANQIKGVKTRNNITARRRR